MIFVGENFWTNEIPIYPLLQHLVSTGKYKNLLLRLTDKTQDIVDELVRFREKHGMA